MIAFLIDCSALFYALRQRARRGYQLCLAWSSHSVMEHRLRANNMLKLSLLATLIGA